MGRIGFKVYTIPNTRHQCMQSGDPIGSNVISESGGKISNNRRRLSERCLPQEDVDRRIINFGVKNRLCKGLEFKIDMPRVDNKKTEDLTPDQLQALLDGRLYIQIHSASAPEGNLWGWLL